LCIISEGQIELRFSVSHYCASKEITPDRINKGEIFGWSALANPYTYTFSAHAVKDSELLRIKRIEGKVKILEGIRPGVVAISWHFGHWAYGSRDVVVDGGLVKGDPTRARGILPNPLMLEDTRVGNVCLTDPIGGSASYFDTPVKIIRL
jgi:hypothetical protein